MLYEIKFIVDDIEDIIWNPSFFENFTIPAAKKKVIITLAEVYISRAFDNTFDDFITGKG